ncbi:MAG: hypothetical protein DI551_09320 [Micavibrio aeruginosavorus]|uniref:Uncharacterized protein n=1 Tax=Micavibrio aeruginosavorus TaxID=349221 RepID=A0A2W5PJR6_9BACT|nr:MAG: hypothetical protein DI551_09320 [Micavibrio aeruginosavorus]
MKDRISWTQRTPFFYVFINNEDFALVKKNIVNDPACFKKNLPPKDKKTPRLELFQAVRKLVGKL